ncbi:prolyl 4-hydroxylase [Oxalobacteraceae bacterium GrIS 1.11]
MNTRIAFAAPLRDWIVHNLVRGIPPQPLARDLAQQGFEADVARDLVHTLWQALASGATLPDGANEPAQIAAATFRRDPCRLALANVAGEPRTRVAARMERPTLAVLDNVLSEAECEQLIALATHRLAPSTMVDPASGSDLASTARSSDSMFFRLQENALLARIDSRVSQLMNLPLENGEGLQVARYRGDAHSAPHFDFLMPTNPANLASLARSGQRVSTLVLYLNDVEEGGETVFPESGFAVAPRKGGALYFEYGNRAGQLDAASLHAAAPAAGGEKWIATKWMRQRKFVPAGA